MITIAKINKEHSSNDTLYQNITDVNVKAKDKSDIEIKQEIIKKLDWVVAYDHGNSLKESNELSLNKIKQSSINDESDHNYGLWQRKKERKKGEKLSKNQIIFIKNLIDSKHISQKDISWPYSISPSWLRNIKKMNYSSLNNVPLRNYKKLTTTQQVIIIDEIKKYYWEFETEFTSLDIQKHLLEKWEIVCSLRMIRRIMKNDLNLTFKKSLTRPNNVDFNRVKALRSMFWVDFADLLKGKSLIINIDEWTISRSTKSNYSWSIKGGNKEAKNSPFIGSLSIILAILSNGNWFLLATDNTINSNILCHFIKKMEYWVFKNNIFGYEKALWILDNCPSHKSKFAYKTLKNTNFRIHFLPAYSPDLAPVEMCFAYLKRKLWSLSKGRIIRLTIKNEQSLLLQAVKSLTVVIIKKWFSSFYETIKHYLNSL